MVSPRLACLAILSTAACFHPAKTDETTAGDGSTSSATGDDDGSATTTITTGITTTASTTDAESSGGTTMTTSSSTTASDTSGETTGADTTTTTAAETTTGGGPVMCNPVLADCAADEYCDAPDCVSQGLCVARPMATSPTMAPACGCDGTSYWNIDHAHWLGATAFDTDIAGCGMGSTSCGGDGDCTADGSACITDHGLGSSSCNNTEQGTCWAIPANANCDNAPVQPDVGYGACIGGPLQCDANALLLCDAMIAKDFFAICL